MPTEGPTSAPTQVPTEVPTQVTATPTVQPTDTPAGSLSGGTDKLFISGLDNSTLTGNSTLAGNSTFTGNVTGTEGGTDLNQTLLSNCTDPYATLLDPALNSSTLSNIFYDNINRQWVINQSGEYYLDLSTLNNTGNVQSDAGTNSFSGFGSGFAILINATNVVLDGMGATLNGNSATSYGIMVNNQSATNYQDFASPTISGISITNITLTGFTQAGIFFNNVVGGLTGTIATNITDVNANSNTNTAGTTGSGIVLQNSQNVLVLTARQTTMQFTGYRSSRTPTAIIYHTIRPQTTTRLVSE